MPGDQDSSPADGGHDLREPTVKALRKDRSDPRPWPRSPLMYSFGGADSPSEPLPSGSMKQALREVRDNRPR